MTTRIGTAYTGNLYGSTSSGFTAPISSVTGAQAGDTAVVSVITRTDPGIWTFPSDYTQVTKVSNNVYLTVFVGKLPDLTNPVFKPSGASYGAIKAVIFRGASAAVSGPVKTASASGNNPALTLTGGASIQPGMVDFVVAADYCSVALIYFNAFTGFTDDGAMEYNGAPFISARAGDKIASAAGTTSDLTTSMASTSDQQVVGVRFLLGNNPPNAPAVSVSSTIDSGASNVIAAPFSDPDPGDTCSQTDFQWWDLDSTGARVGAAHTQTVTGAQPTQWTAPAGTFTDGDKEIQAKSYDALGVASPWGASAFFTAATPTGMPTITDPTNGATIGQTPYTVTWSTAGGQKGYQVRRVKDNAGAADATTVYWDSGQVTGAGADSVRSLSVPFETNGRYEHVQVSVTADGSLWSSWADARVNVSYTPPAAPTFTVDLDAASGSALISITNPAPGTGQPSVSYNDVYVDDGNGKGFERKATLLQPNTAWRYWTPPSGFDPAGNVRVTAVATNGTTASTTSPLNVTDGNSPANTTTTISDGGVVL